MNQQTLNSEQRHPLGSPQSPSWRCQHGPVPPASLLLVGPSRVVPSFQVSTPSTLEFFSFCLHPKGHMTPFWLLVTLEGSVRGKNTRKATRPYSTCGAPTGNTQDTLSLLIPVRKLSDSLKESFQKFLQVLKLLFFSFYPAPPKQTLTL